MSKFLTIQQAADLVGVSPSTLRRWEKQGKGPGVHRTEGGQRRYDRDKIISSRSTIERCARPTPAYARVSRHDQKEDLLRQKRLLEMFCAAQGWSFEIIQDLGSGLNYHKQGLRALLDKIFHENIERLVLTHRDRLLRFGAELVFAFCEMKGIEVVVINQGAETSFEEELAQDVLEIITVFSARLYGSRSHQHKKLREALEQVTSHGSSC
jgi:excisionase family DNA binding protein